MPKNLRPFAVVCFFALICSYSDGAEPVNYNANFQAYGGAVPVQYRAWLPDGYDRIKGLIISLPGSRGDHRGIVSNSLWQFRLMEMGYGIVGFRDQLDFGYDYWGGDASEARSNLQLVLDSVASSFGHPEIANAPVLLDGVSKGGFAAGYLASFVPDRTIGFISDKGYALGTVDSSVYSAPGAIIPGVRDDIVPAAGLHQAFSYSRIFNAHSALMVDWDRGHLETPENLRLALMDQFIRARYPRGVYPSLTPGQPLVLNQNSGWLAEAPQLNDQGMLTYEPPPLIAREQDYPLDPTEASWLPSTTMTMLYEAHNDNTFRGRPVQMTVLNPTGGQVSMRIAVSGINSNYLELYRNDVLLATLDPSSGPLVYSYVARERGLHTFIAKAFYQDGGQTRYTMNYLTTVIHGVVEVPEPTGAAVVVLAGILVFLSRERLVDDR